VQTVRKGSVVYSPSWPPGKWLMQAVKEEKFPTLFKKVLLLEYQKKMEKGE
jgi:hypothetical protein